MTTSEIVLIVLVLQAGAFFWRMHKHSKSQEERDMYMIQKLSDLEDVLNRIKGK